MRSGSLASWTVLELNEAKSSEDLASFIGGAGAAPCTALPPWEGLLSRWTPYTPGSAPATDTRSTGL